MPYICSFHANFKNWSHAADVDNVWKTCCALYNRLLEEDGLNAAWDRGANASDYLGELGLHEGSDAGRHVPAVVARRLDPRTFDLSDMGVGDDPDASEGFGIAPSPSPLMKDAPVPVPVPVLVLLQNPYAFGTCL